MFAFFRSLLAELGGKQPRAFRKRSLLDRRRDDGATRQIPARPAFGRRERLTAKRPPRR